jgi:hypothetical protein
VVDVHYGVGLEWLVVASLLLPVLLLVLLIYFGSRNTV